MTAPGVEGLLRELTPQVLGALVRRHGQFEGCEDAVQDGLPLDPRVTCVVVARHPLDMAVSLYHHYANLDVRRIAELAGQPDPRAASSSIPLREWLLSWIAEDGSPQERPASLTGVVWHARDALSRAAEPNGGDRCGETAPKLVASLNP